MNLIRLLKLPWSHIDSPRLSASAQRSEGQQLDVICLRDIQRNRKKDSLNMKTKYIIPSQMQMSANASYATRVQAFKFQGPNTDHRPKEHLPMLTSTVLGHYCGIVVVCTESGPIRLHGVSNDDMDDSPDTRQADKPD
jgi:hypothetical protein